MASKSAYTVVASLLFILGAKAQVAVWGQCGGIGYTGSTTCDTGAICTKQNDWYSQCLPGTGASSTLATSISTVKPSSTTSSGSSQTSSAASVKYFITFGDSYSQTGFDISGTKPSASNPLGNPPLPGWTSSGGLNWIGYLVSKYNTSALLSYNFAYGGATTDATLVTPYAPTVLSFIDQVTQFSNSLASHPSYAPWTGANTLVGVWMGVNDVGNSYYKSNVSDINAAIMDRYFAQLQILYNAGARNFVLLNVPPIQKTPAMLAQSADAQALEATIITQYNNLVSSRLASFLSANSGSKGWVVDTQAPFNTAISNPTAYGAKDATCYSEVGTSCLWFNDYHPGIAIQELVAKAVAAALKGVFF